MEYFSEKREERDLNMPRELAILACTECKRRNYTTTRNKKTQTERVELMKFCPAEKKRTLHRETK
jgi:large subunit ribosomal protein L33